MCRLWLRQNFQMFKYIKCICLEMEDGIIHTMQVNKSCGCSSMLFCVEKTTWVVIDKQGGLNWIS